MASLELIDVTKVYKGGVKAVDRFTMKIDDGEFIVFVGPSGCGKSTTLRMIAGLEDITEGELYIDGQYMNDVEPKDRNLAMVFQNYALYPYLTVYDNIAFGLKMRHVPKKEIEEKVHAVSKMLGIEELLKRKPKALSGGQRQRVALGRAIVRDAKVYLFDEPLSNLDAKLRASMRVEIIRLYEKLKTTFIYVTHDQVEAMTMGTRIVVMKDGIVQQIDTPTNLYDHPANQFVAGFIGTPPMNFLQVTIHKGRGNAYQALLDIASNQKVPLGRIALKEDYEKQKDFKAVLGIRSEDIRLATKEEGILATIRVVESLGSECLLYLSLTDQEENRSESNRDIVMKLQGRCAYRNGDEIYVRFEKEHIHLFDSDTGDSVVINQ